MRVRTRLLPTALVAIGALLAAGCEADDDAPQDPGQTQQEPGESQETGEETGEATGDETAGDETTEGDAAVGEAVPEQVTLETAESDEHGEYVVDGDGRTVYVNPFFGEDDLCENACAYVWTPVLVDGEPEAGDGIRSDLIGTIDREDGTTQVTYDGQPLHRFINDVEPGDHNGHDTGDWFVVAPDGSPIGGEEAVAEAEAAAETGDEEEEDS